MQDAQTVFVIDDDPSVLQSLELLLVVEGYAVETYKEPARFLESLTKERRGCVVVDLYMPSMSGLSVQAELVKRGPPMPIIFISGYQSSPAMEEAMRAGALDFLTKPYDEEHLLATIARALAG